MVRTLLLVTTLLLGGVALFFNGCAGDTPAPQSKNRKPEWIRNPNLGGKVGAVGVAGRTYDQRISTQRKFAIQRALDELAMQQGVKVSLSMTKEEHVANEQASTSMESKSTYRTTNEKTISAHIEAVWQDPLTNELYVWLVLDR